MPKYYSKSGAKSTFNKKSQDGKEISMQISPYTWMMRDIDKLIKESEDIAPQETRKMEEFIKRFLPETWKVFGGEQYIEEWNDFPGEVESYYIEEYETQNETIGKYEESDLYLGLLYGSFLRKYTQLPEGEFKIYRYIDTEAIDPNKSLKEQLKKLGVHWTIDKQVAKKRGQIIFTALVFKSNVDWRKTLLTNTYYPEEKEIWLKDNSEVYVEKIEDLETGKIDEIEDIYPAD